MATVLTKSPTFRRRWLQFSLRTLLIATSLAGCFFGLVAVKLHQAMRRQQAVDAIVEGGGDVIYAYQVRADGEELRNPVVPEQTWLRTKLGNAVFDDVVEVRVGTDALLGEVKHFPHLVKLGLFCSSQISDAGLANLEDVPQLQQLDFGMAQHVTDRGMAHVSKLTHLRRLDMTYLEITDAGLEQLQSLTQLQEFTQPSAKVSDDGIRKLQAALPNCRIER